jgi:hypothetical protein
MAIDRIRYHIKSGSHTLHSALTPNPSPSLGEGSRRWAMGNLVLLTGFDISSTTERVQTKRRSIATSLQIFSFLLKQPQRKLLISPDRVPWFGRLVANQRDKLHLDETERVESP